MAAEGGLRRQEDFLPDVQHTEEEEEEEEEVDFPPYFRKYMKRKLNFSRLKSSDKNNDGFRGGVFWNQEDDGCVDQPLFSFTDADIGANRKVRLKIRQALHELILLPELYGSLVQFWAPTKTSEGQTLLTSQNKPFALSYYYPYEARDNMCKYRMEMCEEYPYFYADANCSEEQLGLPGRVFLHQFTEFNLSVSNYSKEEYPQLELALRCRVQASWALPVFELSSQSCLGVLEVVFNSDDNDLYFFDGEPSSKFYDIFQEFGLLCFDGYEHLNMEGKKEAIRDACAELRPMLESGCETHSLPLALTWLSGGLCSDVLENECNLNGLSSRIGGGDCELCRSNFNLQDFVEASRLCVLKKGQFTGRKLPFPNLLYRSDVKQFSIAEYPLVPYARKCKLSGCFTMCLQSSCTGHLYVIELFFPASNDNNENILTTLRLILNTTEEHSKKFMLASGQGFGEELPVEFIDFENGQKSHSVKMIPARSIPLHERLMSLVRQLDEPSVDAVNSRMPVATEAQNSNLPSLDFLQDEEVTTQLDSSHQPSMDTLNKGRDVITLARNNRVASSSNGSKRKMKDTEHEKAGVRIDVSLEEIRKCSQMTRHDAAKKLKVGVSTLKRLCRDYGIPRWPPRDIENLPVEGHTPQLNSDLPSNEASGSVADTTIRFQDADKVTIHAKYEDLKIKFHLSSSSKLRDLQQEVAKRLDLMAGTYHIEYKDKEEELTLIACDDDLQDCIQYFRSLESTLILLHLRRRLPLRTGN